MSYSNRTPTEKVIANVIIAALSTGTIEVIGHYRQSDRRLPSTSDALEISAIFILCLAANFIIDLYREKRKP